MKPDLGRLIVVPFATIGVLAAVLLWTIEHVTSSAVAGAIIGGGIVIGTVVARDVRRAFDRFARHYEALARDADELSQRADATNRAKDEFLAALSHELRTPLNSILGWSRLLASGKLDPQQTQKAISAIERAGWTQSRLIEDLLDLSRIVAGRLELSVRPALVQPLVESAVESLRAAADAKRIRITTTVDHALGPMSIDPDRIRQVVWNLLSNAIKFTPSGGDVNVSLARDSRGFSIVVDDTGIGFEPHVAAHLFERFHQGDSSSTRLYGGLGLGLGIVRHLVELHGGTVSASSRGTGTGSRFEVHIPIRPVTAPRIEAAPPPAAHAPTLRGVSVLVVDDDPANLEFVRATLEQYGAIVVTVSTVPEAEARIRREPPDVVVTDLVMPGRDGWELIRAIRQLDEQAGRRTPAAALTALARTEDRKRALNAGFEIHLAKPIDPSELVSTVERLAHVH
jgi:signal transduction histidine kinase/CheY-like chemotaxis protein